MFICELENYSFMHAIWFCPYSKGIYQITNQQKYYTLVWNKRFICLASGRKFWKLNTTFKWSNVPLIFLATSNPGTDLWGRRDGTLVINIPLELGSFSQLEAQIWLWLKEEIFQIFIQLKPNLLERGQLYSMCLSWLLYLYYFSTCQTMLCLAMSSFLVITVTFMWHLGRLICLTHLQPRSSLFTEAKESSL